MSEQRSTLKSRSSCVGIWRLLDRFHVGRWTELYFAQPAEAAGSPRADYVVKLVTDDIENRIEGTMQLQNEAMAIQSVSHPNLIAMLDTQLSATRPYLVFPRLEGQPLSVWLGGACSQPIPVCLWWIRQATQALSALHSAGWMHGDIKTDNMLVSARGHLTLIDCGLSRRIGAVADSNRFQGTPGYAAPEVLKGAEAAGPESDIYALGIVFYQMLSRKPKVGPTFKPDFADLRLHQVYAPLIELVQKMTSPVPSQRPGTQSLINEIFRLEIELLGKHIRPADDIPNVAA